LLTIDDLVLAVSAVQEHAQKASRRGVFHAERPIEQGYMYPYLAVNSSKLSSWCPASSDSLRVEVLKLLADPEVAIRAGTA
jgi:hypothetical protein